MPPQSQKTIARSLGQFIGHILHGVRTPVGSAGEPPDSQTVEVSRETQTQGRVTPMGMVTVRRTVIEEVELPGAVPRTDAQSDEPTGAARGGGRRPNEHHQPQQEPS